MTTYQDLPLELRHEIGKLLDLKTYANFVLADPAFGHLTIAPDINLEYQKQFTVEELPNRQWRLNGKLHHIDGPAWISQAPDRLCSHPYRQKRDEYVELWYHHGELHREQGPALTVKDAQGKVILQKWFKHGVQHRADGPAEYHVDLQSKTDGYHWYLDGQMFNAQGGPTTLQKNPVTGEAVYIEYRPHGKWHRDDGPALINVKDDYTEKVWFRNNLYLSGPEQPTYIKENSDGSIREVNYASTRELTAIYHRDLSVPSSFYHRESDANGQDRPAKIIYHENGDIEKEYHINGDYRDHKRGPSYTKETKDGQVLAQKWYRDVRFGNSGIQLHRIDGPAYLKWHRNGQMHKQQWHRYGSPHCDVHENGKCLPAFTLWGEKGNKLEERWYINTHITNFGDIPTYVRYNEQGQVICKQWRHNAHSNKLHREYGPAWQEWNDQGELMTQAWYLKGKAVSYQKILDE